MTRSVPGSMLARHKPQAPHPAPPSQRLATTPLSGQDHVNKILDYGAIRAGDFRKKKQRRNPSIAAEAEVEFHDSGHCVRTKATTRLSQRMKSNRRWIETEVDIHNSEREDFEINIEISDDDTIY